MFVSVPARNLALFVTTSALAATLSLATGVASSHAAEAASTSAAVPATSGSSDPTSPGSDTAFKPLAVGAGGFVTGMSISDDGATRLVRTDTYGGYRWADNRWQLDVTSHSLPASDVSPGVGGGVLAVAVAPSDASVAYMATHNAVYRSADAGQSWTKVLADVSTAPNDDFRNIASRLTVDPQDPDVVYYGSQLDGLYITRNGGASWTRVPTAALPAGVLVDLSDPEGSGSLSRATDVMAKGPHLAGAGISWVVIDRGSPVTNGRSSVLYAASYGEGVYRSSDAGVTWTRISPDGMAPVTSMRVQTNGDLILVAHADTGTALTPSDVWRLHDGAWSKTPVSTKVTTWRALAVDPSTPGRVVLMGLGGTFAVSRDYGATWKVLPRTLSSAADVPWLAWALTGGTHYMSVGEITFDPTVAGRLWLTEGTGVWYADLGADPTVVNWVSQSRGIEQLAPTSVIAPPGGKPVMTAWDRPIFRSEDPDTYPTYYGPVNQFGSAWSADWSVSDPSYLVASVASHHAPSDPSSSGYSTDGGKTWTAFPTIPQHSTNSTSTFGFGTMAVSSPGNVVWVPAYGHRPQYTLDGGKTWAPIQLPGITDYSHIDQQPYYVYRRIIAADKATPGTFYLYAAQNGTYRSVDGGRTWTQMSDDSAFDSTSMSWNTSLKAVPGHAGELYLTPGPLGNTTSQPFFHSTDGGATWTRVAHVSGVTAFGYGKAFPREDHPAIYVAGYVDGVYGIYRSTDNAASWTFLTDYPTGRTSGIRDIDGDKDIVGRVYLAISGSGWSYGDLVQSPATEGSGTPSPAQTEPPVTPTSPSPSPSPTEPPKPPKPTKPTKGPGKVKIKAPQRVRAGRSFVASVSAPGRSTVSYRWSVSGCRVSHPKQASVTVSCDATHGASRRLRVRLTTAEGVTTKVWRSIQIRSRAS